MNYKIHDVAENVILRCKNMSQALGKCVKMLAQKYYFRTMQYYYANVIQQHTNKRINVFC